MPALQGFDVLLQVHDGPAGSGTCEGFTGVAAARPAWIMLLSEGSAGADSTAQALASALRTALVSLDPAVKRGSVPCGGLSHGLDCLAEQEPACSKLLVWLADQGSAPQPLHELRTWLARPGHQVLPVLHRSRDADAILPAELRHLNAAMWDQDSGEVAPVVLASSGLVSQERRLFISYRRAETQALADQLFDGLSHAGFDVFLDRFRLPPGVDFAARLAEELAEKGMVVLLESPDVRLSRWVLLEVDFARKHRLGLLALHPPGATSVKGLSGRRISLAPSEVTGRFPYPGGQPGATQPLTPAAMDRILRAVFKEHARALTARRKLLRDSLRLALASENVPIGSISYPAFGVRVRIPAGTYGIGLSVRPAAVDDFYAMDSDLGRPSERGWLVSPLAGLQTSRRDRIDWLAGKAGIDHVDEGDLAQLAAQIVKGVP